MKLPGPCVTCFVDDQFETAVHSTTDGKLSEIIPQNAWGCNHCMSMWHDRTHHQPIAVRTTMTAIIDWHIDHPFPLRRPEPLVAKIDYRHLLMVLVVLYSLNVWDFKQRQLLRCGEQPNHLPVNSYRPIFIFWWWFGPWYIPATPPIWWINTTQPTSSTPFSHSTSAAMGHDWRAAHTGHRHRAFRSCNMAKTLEMAGVFPFVCSGLVFSCDKFHIIPIWCLNLCGLRFVRMMKVMGLEATYHGSIYPTQQLKTALQLTSRYLRQSPTPTRQSLLGYWDDVLRCHDNIKNRYYHHISWLDAIRDSPSA